MLPLLASLRPHQWTKNMVVFAAVFFSGRGGSGADLLAEALAFALFCGLASSIYLMNDLVDAERDRLHPLKRHRPVASRQVPAVLAAGASLLLGAGALGGAFLLLPPGALQVLAGYAVLQLAYSFWLKHVVIVDALCIATGFLLRVLAGVMAIGAAISPWIIACSVQLALFLALCKRKAEAASLGEGEAAQRPALADYAGPATDLMIGVMATATLVTYTLYTIVPWLLKHYAPNIAAAERFGAPGMIWTLPFVLYGILRYLFLVYHRQRGERPEYVLLTDLPLLGSIFAYALVAGWAVYSLSPRGV